MDQLRPGDPQAFAKPNKRDFYSRRLLWALIFGLFIVIVGRSMGIRKRFVEGNFIQKNSLRFFCLMFVSLIGFGAFLLINTSHEGDRSQNMIDEWPVAAFSMSGMMLMMTLASFHFFTDLLGPVGFLYFIAFWGFTLNSVMIIPL